MNDMNATIGIHNLPHIPDLLIKNRENAKYFVERLKDAGIMTSQVHNRNDINSCVKEYEEPLPNLDMLEKELSVFRLGGV